MKNLVLCTLSFFVIASYQCSAFQDESAHKVARIQEPFPPYPYYEEEVTFHNRSDKVTLSATLTIPQGQGPFPAVILLHGSGPMERDLPLFGHKLFLVWADYLTRQGIAVLRFDKRGAGKSTGDFNNATIEEFAHDALAGVDYLKTRGDVKTDCVGLIGHSEGGMTALMAVSKSQEISFVVLLAAPCVNWEKLVLEQEPALQEADGVSEATIAKIQALRKQVLALLKTEGNRVVAERKLRELLSQNLSQFSAEERKVAEAYYGPLESQVQLFNSLGFRYNFTYEPEHTLKRIEIPVLALNGDLDFVVSPQQNLLQIKKTLKEIEHKDYVVMELPGLNHAFQACQTGSMAEYSKIEMTTSPLVLSLISNWILEKTGAAKFIKSS